MAVLTSHLSRHLILTNNTFCFFSQVTDECRLEEWVMFWLRTLYLTYTVCPTRYRTRNFFNNSNTNEDIAKKFEQKYVCCVRNEEECVCSVCMQCA